MTATLQTDAQLEQEDTQRGRFLIFTLGEGQYGIQIRHVKEIIGIQSITSMPDMPDYIKGVINLRGKIIPVIDVHLRFKQPSMEYTERTCFIVIDTNEISVGLIVDNVAEVLSISDDDIVPPPPENIGVYNKYVYGFGKINNKVILLLDCEKLVTGDEADELKKSVEGVKNEAF